MSFALEDNEEVSAGVMRIALEQIELAHDHIRTPSEDLNKSVHVVRQSLKRLRALVALAHDELGDKVFRHEWACYRDAGRLLAGARDAAVVAQTLDSMVSRFSSGLPHEPFASERRLLTDLRDARLKMMIEEEGALEQVSETLILAAERVAAWPVKRTGFTALRGGVKRSYRAGREGFRNVVRHPSPTHFHTWRRPVKLLLHQLQILTPIWPLVLHAHAEELHTLSDRLNENHDFDLLRQALESQIETQPRDRDSLAALIGLRCREFEAEALPLGERLFSERPREFTRRIGCYWRVWERSRRNSATVAHSSENIALATGAQ